MVKRDKTKRFAKQLNEILKIAYPVDALHQRQPLVGFRQIAITFDDAFRSVVENALPEVMKRNIPITIFVPSGYLGMKPTWIPEPIGKYDGEVVLTSDELRCLAMEGVSIGSHTVNHLNLTIEEDDIVKHEISDSKEQLQQVIGKEINMLAFPFGGYDERALRLSKAAGYRRVFSNLPRTVTATDETNFLGRIGVDPDDWLWEFRLKIRGAYQWLPIGVEVNSRLKTVGRKMMLGRARHLNQYRFIPKS
jgi:peptidoglycan/xylan/chitin deacetylase (PgdA/CDA1 family)